MMYELWVGKINEENYQRDKDSYSPGISSVRPYDILSNRFELFRCDWFYLLEKVDEFFDNMTWMDIGSFFCRGNYDQMKRFLEWLPADTDEMNAFMDLPSEGDYGFVFIEDY